MKRLAQSHKMQYLSQFFFLYRSSLTIQYKNMFQRLAVFLFSDYLNPQSVRMRGLSRRGIFLLNCTQSSKEKKNGYKLDFVPLR